MVRDGVPIGTIIHNARLFREIQRQKQYSDALVETSPVAIATMDLDGTVVGWNPGAERLFGYRPAEAIGRPMEDLVATPELREEVRANIRHTLEGEWIRAIARRARKDGTLMDVEISSMPVDYLFKPVNPVLLEARVGASLEKKRLRDQQRGAVPEVRDRGGGGRAAGDRAVAGRQARRGERDVLRHPLLHDPIRVDAHGPVQLKTRSQAVRVYSLPAGPRP